MQLCVYLLAQINGGASSHPCKIARIKSMCIQINWSTRERRALIPARFLDREERVASTARPSASDVYFHRAWITADKFLTKYVILPRQRERQAERRYKCCAMNFVRGGRRAFLPPFQDKIANHLARICVYNYRRVANCLCKCRSSRSRASNWTAGFLFFFFPPPFAINTQPRRVSAQNNPPMRIIDLVYRSFLSLSPSPFFPPRCLRKRADALIWRATGIKNDVCHGSDRSKISQLCEGEPSVPDFQG